MQQVLHKCTVIHTVQHINHVLLDWPGPSVDTALGTGLASVREHP